VRKNVIESFKPRVNLKKSKIALWYRQSWKKKNVKTKDISERHLNSVKKN
jgi:hypothetical protein